MTIYSATDFRTKLFDDFGAWTGKHVIVRAGNGVVLADGVLVGLKPKGVLAVRRDGSNTTVPGGADYGFGSGGPIGGGVLEWDSSHSIEVVQP